MITPRLQAWPGCARRWGPFVAILAAVLAFQVYAWFLKRSGETAYLPPDSALVAPAYVGGESIVRQTFEMRADGLQSVRLFARPRSAPPVGTAHLELVDAATGVSVTRTTLPAAALTAAAPFEWTIPRIDHSMWRSYQIVISVPDAPSDRGLLLDVGAPLYAGGALTVAGRDVWGDLRFSTRASRARAIDAMRQLRQQAPPWGRSELLVVAIGLLVNLALARLFYDLIVAASDEG
jgi:hypothetical protein